MKRVSRNSEKNLATKLTETQRILLAILFSVFVVGLLTNQWLLQERVVTEPPLVVIPLQLVIILGWSVFAFSQFCLLIKRDDEAKKRRKTSY